MRANLELLEALIGASNAWTTALNSCCHHRFLGKIQIHGLNLPSKLQMKSQPQYHEGPEAKERFDNAMRTIFQTPKPNPRKPKRKRLTTRKHSDKS